MADRRARHSPRAQWMFGAAGLEHNEKYGSTVDHFVRIAAKNHRHSVNNPYAQFQNEYTLDEIKSDKMIYPAAELTRTMCSPTSDGSGAAVVASRGVVGWDGLGHPAREDHRSRPRPPPPRP